jgi:hypothetical protein
VIVELARDRALMKHCGDTFITAELAMEYGIDIDGTVVAFDACRTRLASLAPIAPTGQG